MWGGGAPGEVSGAVWHLAQALQCCGQRLGGERPDLQAQASPATVMLDPRAERAQGG